MRITILAVGRLKSGPESDLVARYHKRAEATGRSLGLTAVQVKEIAEARAPSADERRRAEAQQLLARLPDGAHLVLLDEAGEDTGSEALADQLRALADAGRKDLAFAIGGPDGHGGDLRARANGTLRFGRATWPHQLVRVMLMEQIYRAMTILSGHPYHRA
ncbi:23S rRNA (pseudouridine(1915)-N(3))-methyltransferase RlmH [Lutibaculum baratangense]|uniref:Ribosomal RNA large subunit methyltransferase H n=1 Tax=Lutibaculum baratangense AMV1 TaxID=631454 RepID=V4RQ68_9HYPH|nr:23S rRNA (pseudouridine(1915)-N(3))-methyltransferase RlmH [Lutibaculum baratangense]ESR25330.1 methyltransferase RlmH [Lutibaculum baratangense AMV1]